VKLHSVSRTEAAAAPRRQPNTRRRIGFGCVYYTESVQPSPLPSSPPPPAAGKLGGNGVYRVVAAADTDCSSRYVLLGIPPTHRTLARQSLYDERSHRRCRRRGRQRRAPFPPPPLFRFCVWPTRSIETGGRCDSILDGTVALLAFAGMVVSSWLTLSTSNSASIQAEKTYSAGFSNSRTSGPLGYKQTKLYRLQFLS
jgi:hypothetical protein